MSEKCGSLQIPAGLKHRVRKYELERNIMDKNNVCVCVRACACAEKIIV